MDIIWCGARGICTGPRAAVLPAKLVPATVILVIFFVRLLYLVLLHYLVFLHQCYGHRHITFP